MSKFMALAKIFGTVGLGSSTGLLAAAVAVDLPFAALKKIQILNWSVSITSLILFSSAYIFAAPQGRHPYLFYAALTAPLCFAIENVPLPATSASTTDSSSPSSLSSDSPLRPSAPVANDTLSDADISDKFEYAKLDSESDDLSSYASYSSPTEKPTNASPASRNGSSRPRFRLPALAQQWAQLAVTSLGALIATVGIYGDFA